MSTRTSAAIVVVIFTMFLSAASAEASLHVQAADSELPTECLSLAIRVPPVELLCCPYVDPGSSEPVGYNDEPC